MRGATASSFCTGVFFNSHPSHEERQTFRHPWSVHRAISTHTPYKGCPNYRGITAAYLSFATHAPRMRGNQIIRVLQQLTCLFLSTHAPHMRDDSGKTTLTKHLCFATHAPHARGDSPENSCVCESHFNSRPDIRSEHMHRCNSHSRAISTHIHRMRDNDRSNV